MLLPEPKNKADPRAIAVFSHRGVQIGYLTAERAPWIGKLIRDGREVQAVFQEESERGAWIRVAFDGAVPELPAKSLASAGATEQAEEDWFPDEVYPDD
jgi:hypothetical protein